MPSAKDTKDEISRPQRRKFHSRYVWGPALVALAGSWVCSDYRSWQELGRGGLPGTFGGWLRTTWLRLQMRDPLDVSRLRQARWAAGDVALLSGLPVRRAPRPRVGAYPVPHRQVDQRASRATFEALIAVFDAAVLANGDGVEYALSHFEKHTKAVTCRADVYDLTDHVSHGEVAHVHALDGSMHMILSPSDAVLAVENGWGELHGLAGKSLGLPEAYVMVYAPQSLEDVAVAGRLLAAAIGYMTATRTVA